MSKTIIFQTIQFSISTQFISIGSIDWTLSGTTTTGLSGPGSDVKAWLLAFSKAQDFVLNNQQWLICHKTKVNKIKFFGHLTVCIYKICIQNLYLMNM